MAALMVADDGGHVMRLVNSGRLLRRVRGVRLSTQHESWVDRHHVRAGSLFAGYEAVMPDPGTPGGDRSTAGVRRVVVVLGMSESYGFRRLLDRLSVVLPADAEVLWQTGATDVTGLHIDARPRIDAAELCAAMADADVVVAHAGTDSALAALQAGRFPVLVPRRPEFGEHEDDGQQQVAAMLGARGLAATAEVGGVSLDLLVAAAATRVRRTGPVLSV